jgi:UDP-N-acetylmuramoyl-tripeptide--D-alanyl-D-alanine ligase
MLQLNSYYNKRFFGYLKKNKTEFVDFKAIISLFAYVFFYFGKFSAVSAYALIYLICDMLKKRPVEKKPLVVTARVKRLFVTEGIIIAAFLAAGLFVSPKIVPLMFFFAAFSAPYAVSAANLINAPIETAIRKGFVKKAEEKLKSMPNLKIIGITGSYGKTSVKNFVSAMLSEKYNTLMTPHSFNTTMGVVRTVNESLTPLHEVFVVEMGARNKGDIKEICDLVKPESGIITSIGPQHLETFKTIENVIDTKFELCDASVGGYKFLNYDNEYVRGRKTDGNTVTYGTTPDCDFYAKDISVTPSGSSFTLVTKNGEKTIHTKLIGSHNVVNIVGAAAVAITYGVSLDSVAVAARRLESVEHRLEIKQGNGCTIIDDAYNSNPEGAKSALETLKLFDGCTIVITPGMVELGEREEEENEKLGAKAAECAKYAIFVGEKQAPALKRGAMRVTDDENRIIVAKDIYEAFNIMRSIDEENKIVLLENDLPDNYL